MNDFLLAFTGGLLGAALMDVTEAALARVGIRSGVTVALVGRWCLGLMQGRLVHDDIRSTPARAREVGAGWAFHFAVGGGGVALGYPVLQMVLGAHDLAHPVAHPVLGGLGFGLLTSVLPWFVLLPAFGWGVFGRRGPPGSRAWLASPLSHVPYGLGVGVMVAFGSLARGI